MLKTLRPAISAPIVIFSYANPILRMGLETFVSEATRGRRRRRADAGHAARGRARRSATAFAGAGIDTIFLLSPTTTVERIRRASALGSGFLYGISRLGVTGVRDTVDDSARELAERVKSETHMPLALGFGISRPEHVRAIGAVGRRRGGRKRAGQSDRGARAAAGIVGRSGAVRAMAAELSLERAARGDRQDRRGDRPPAR